MLPTFLHYCQFFRAGEIGFQKRRVTSMNVFTWESDILLDLYKDYSDLGTVDYKNRDGEKMRLSPEQARRNTFALCTVYQAINAAVLDYKQRMCGPDETGLAPSANMNLKRTINVVPNPPLKSQEFVTKKPKSKPKPKPKHKPKPK